MPLVVRLYISKALFSLVIRYLRFNSEILKRNDFTISILLSPMLRFFLLYCQLKFIQSFCMASDGYLYVKHFSRRKIKFYNFKDMSTCYACISTGQNYYTVTLLVLRFIYIYIYGAKLFSIITSCLSLLLQTVKCKWQ